MNKILHVMTREGDELAEAIMAADLEADMSVTVIRLSAADPDYKELLEAVFEADSVQSW
jgi:hypothetical protein